MTDRLLGDAILPVSRSDVVVLLYFITNPSIQTRPFVKRRTEYKGKCSF